MSGVDPTLEKALDAFALRRRVLVGVDFDGTLAPLVDDPAAARLAPGARPVLERLSELPGTGVAVVSGRDLDTLHELTGLPRDGRIVLIGSHGAQTSLAADLDATLLGDAQQRALTTLRLELEHIADTWPGTRVEHKPTSVVLHTRGLAAEMARSANAEAHKAAGRQRHVQVLGGKDVVEIAVVDTDKGRALHYLAGSIRAQVVAYFGDDLTDEHAFEVLEPLDGDVRVKVGAGDSLAEHRVARVEDVVTALERVLRVRREQP